MPSNPDESSGRVRDMIPFARKLQQELSANVRVPSMDIRICVHRDDAFVQEGEKGVELSGGPLAHLSQWLPREWPRGDSAIITSSLRSNGKQ